MYVFAIKRCLLLVERKGGGREWGGVREREREGAKVHELNSQSTLAWEWKRPMRSLCVKSISLSIFLFVSKYFFFCGLYYLCW
jgi:hypothetical protein